MDRSNDSGGSERADSLSRDTNITAPWPTFLLAAWSQDRSQAIIYILVALVPAVIVGGYLAVAYPGSLQALPMIGLVAYAGATMLAERQMCRNVMVIVEDGDRIVIDEQSWWRADERAIPDAVKYWDGKRAEAWLYERAGEYVPLVVWREVLPIDENTATASHISGIRTSMGSAGRVARHRKRDTSEIARYGLLAAVILFGLLALYLAGSRAVDAFIGTSGPVG